ncbi:hypothetical protein HA402_009651 [Bradysia odoriphaga]|nr:hypothetical protein HA402_009651 [Bradysia odoriphaga]
MDVDVSLQAKEPPGAAKPTKYHYYPHNQHIYLLPECAIQQVCNAVYVRLNYTQPLCACPSRYRDPCSASINEDDLHTTKLTGDGNKKAITLAKTCESTSEMRECRSPRDWSLLALQNTRTGKSHYLVICRCPDDYILEGPMAHDQPTYASVPGIRVFGMMCVKPNAVSTRTPAYQPAKQNPYRQPPAAYQPTTSYQPQSYHQNQYQSNYQYLHRTDNSRTTSPRTTYHRDPAVTIQQYDDAYGRTADASIEASSDVPQVQNSN